MSLIQKVLDSIKADVDDMHRCGVPEGDDIWITLMSIGSRIDTVKGRYTIIKDKYSDKVIGYIRKIRGGGYSAFKDSRINKTFDGSDAVERAEEWIREA